MDRFRETCAGIHALIGPCLEAPCVPRLGKIIERAEQPCCVRFSLDKTTSPGHSRQFASSISVEFGPTIGASCGSPFAAAYDHKLSWDCIAIASAIGRNGG